MGLRDSRYTLTKQVELDEAFIEMTYPKDENDPDDKLKRGRGSQRQVKVLVMAESIDSDKPKAKRKSGKECKHIKMVVMSDLTSETIDKVVEKSIDKEAEVTTDGYRSYKNLKNKVAKHNWLIIPPEEAGKLLPWVHTMISNVKRTLLGTYHMIKGGYMQNYLNEFCYKVNRRYFRDKLFDRLMVAVVSDTWYGKFVQFNGESFYII